MERTKDATSPQRHTPQQSKSWAATPRCEEGLIGSDEAVRNDVYVNCIVSELESFYEANPQIQESHGLSHAMAVHDHAAKAIARAVPPPSATEATEIRIAALLHDVDDHKYFPDESGGSLGNARKICAEAEIPKGSVERIVAMIRWVGCSENGNAVPPEVKESSSYHLLIPRWSDRLEAVGAVGVVRCYRYNLEKGRPLWSEASPRAGSEEEVFRLATPERFDAYLSSGGKSDDMISHYYDKLLHIARPPPAIVKNAYLEESAKESARELVEVCVRFGTTGKVDEAYILELEKKLKAKGGTEPKLVKD